MHLSEAVWPDLFAQACKAAAQARPDATSTTLLAFGPERIWVVSGERGQAPHHQALPWGLEGASAAFFRNDLPTPLEWERAIDAVEDELMKLKPLPGSLLVCSGLREWAQAAGAWPERLDGAKGSVWFSREGVEAVFQRLASASLGNPQALHGLPTGRKAAMALLLVREFMHHLDHSELLCPGA